MTLTTDAQVAMANYGLDREDALVVAKVLGQTIIDESLSSAQPLSSMVYDVWGLYNDGMPACRFEVADDGASVRFVGKFRAKQGGEFAERRRELSLEDMDALVEEAVRVQAK